MKPIAVYDGLSMKRLAYLQNAYDIEYAQDTRAMWTASFKLPHSDAKNDYCQAFNCVDIWDVDGGGQNRYVGLFRIMPRVEDSINIEGSVQYTLEHVISTLLDDVALGWHEIGNAGTYTNQVINYILDKQIIKRWSIGECDYNHEYLYGWQDENLLSALYSVVEPFYENDFYWSFDTSVYPWRLNLKKISGIAITDIRYKKNLAGLTKTVDPSNLTTRLYCYGYGDGDNKLNISNVNGGVPYLESPNIAKYGIITQVWTDERFTVEESLKSTGEAMLKKLEEPEITYTIDIQMIEMTANLKIGDTVRVVNNRLNEYMVVQKFQKNNVSGEPKNGKIILGNGTNDIGSSIADLAERQRISETYSQGSESIFMDSFYDNADNANPAESTFIIPDNAVHVNEIRFSAKLANFRAYSKATLGGGATTQTSSSGGGSSVTSSSGGGVSTSSGSGGGYAATSVGGGGGSYGAETSDPFGTLGGYTTLDGGYSGSPRSNNGGGNVDTSGASGTTVAHTHVGGWHTHTLDLSIPDHQHYHSLPNHKHSVMVVMPNHSHLVTISSHTHDIYISSHSHTVTIPTHTHTIELPNHTHAIEYGIYKGPIASQMTIYLDETLIGTYTSSVSNLNLISYMSKNANGDVLRGEHIIKIVPSSLTRIECAYQIRMFTNSRGSGQY